MLSPEQITEFKKNGILVIENTLTHEEVDIARHGLHQQLLNLDIDHNQILNSSQMLDDSGPRIKSKVARIFYAKWKLDIHMHKNVVDIMEHLINATFNSNDPNFSHPYGKFNNLLAYVDRVCWRTPDHIRAEGGLGVHLDRDPVDPYLFKCGGLPNWKPIQAFVALTDHFGSESGGIRVVKGFHHHIDEYFAGKKSEGGGNFYRMHSKSHAAVRKQCQPIYVPAGSLVCWDNRIPHSTCDKLTGNDTREVIYTGFMPDIELNKNYADRQLESIKLNKPPPAFITDIHEKSDRNWTLDELTQIQKKMLGFLKE